MVKKTTKVNMGRQKIEIAKIAKKNHLQVTFSKRRSGLFKKASELCTLCGAEVAIVVFSPSGKVFSFGHPDVDSLIDRFLSQNPPNTRGNCAPTRRLAEAHLNVQLMEAVAQLEAEKKRAVALEEMRRMGRREFWWEAPVEELGLGELQQLRVHLEELKRDVVTQAARMSVAEAVNNTTPFLPNEGTGVVNYSYNTMSFKGFNFGFYD